ncbi:SRPBCC domain-containing protein [Kibdelosporangium philippinense]|uniref:SRPBCC domain-containing protein n=1 Tax=Kibdelosporangium philippinense TaxID=211113 RepID=A0ABS8ZMA9_9PSEU|nr:SRPBCC family protein [Kibdelosporangium philippinense]MCE7007593.1 SRPBCC domain-containing protein [Kibdelosporangium philippinense]
MTERATLSTIDGKPTLRFERRLRHAPAKVWRAITEPAELAHWFPAAIEAELRPGAPMRFVFPEEAVVDGAWDGEVLEFDPPKVFMFRWNEDVLRFELIPDGDGCRLVFTQTVGGGWIGKLGAARTAAGWDQCLAAMHARLNGETLSAEDSWLSRAERYIDEFGLGEGTVRETDDGYTLHFARDLVWKPPAEAWALLTENSPVNQEPPLPATNDHAPPGRVIVANEPNVLEYEWLADGSPAGTVRWEFASDPQLGVRVELTQTIPAARADTVAESLATWHVHLERFFAALLS